MCLAQNSSGHIRHKRTILVLELRPRCRESCSFQHKSFCLQLNRSDILRLAQNPTLFEANQ